MGLFYVACIWIKRITYTQYVAMPAKVSVEFRPWYLTQTMAALRYALLKIWQLRHIFLWCGIPHSNFHCLLQIISAHFHISSLWISRELLNVAAIYPEVISQCLIHLTPIRAIAGLLCNLGNGPLPQTFYELEMAPSRLKAVDCIIQRH